MKYKLKQLREHHNNHPQTMYLSCQPAQEMNA